MTILIIVFGIVILGLIIILIRSNISVMKANKYFYNELIYRGIHPHEAKSIMDAENRNYQNRIKSGERGLLLINHLNEVLERDFNLY
jgi:hypothetical protein